MSHLFYVQRYLVHNFDFSFFYKAKSFMKKILLLICCSLIFSALLSQTADDEKAIHTVFDKMQQAWAAHDYAYTQYDILDSSAILINPVGMYWKNKAEITKGLQYLGEVRFKFFKTIEDSIGSIRFLSL